MGNLDFSANASQLEQLAAYMASQINVPTIGIGGGYAPIGTIISVMGTTAPQDYLACDGTVYNIADYPQLANYFESQFGESNHFGGNGTTTFAVPDLQGEFLRGAGTNSHENQGSGANVGVHQDATEIPFVGKNPTTATTDIVAANANLLAKTDYVTSVDAPTGLHRGLVSARSSDSYGQIYKSRPTNTSVLYCIKAVVAGEVYSTDERVVGTWIDGKPLYQKTFINNTVHAGNVGWYDIASLADLNIEQVLEFSGYSQWRDGNNNNNIYTEPHDFSIDTGKHEGHVMYNPTKNTLSSYKMTSASRSWLKDVITLLYTKTTD